MRKMRMSVSEAVFDRLCQRVTAAIWETERSRTTAGYYKVSRIEEAIARVVHTSEFEGRIARRGAVSAAMNAGMKRRARTLVTRFSTERGCSGKLKAELAALIS